MKPLVLLLIGAVAVAAGAGTFAMLAESQLGGEASKIGARLGFRPGGGGGASQLLGLVDAVEPGASDALKTAAITTAVGGALAGVLVYAVAREVIG